MANIYRYQLRNRMLRNNIFLSEYTEIIQSVLNDHFNRNIKDSFVEDTYFEFTLYASVPVKSLQEMGRKLKSQLPIGIQRYGFVRMEQTLYAIIYQTQDDMQDDVLVEFIDSKILDRPELFLKRAQLFFEKISGNKLLSERDYTDNTSAIINNYYVDVSDSYVNKRLIRKFFDCKDRISCFFVKGYHRRYNDDIKSDNIFRIEKCFDVGYIKNRQKIVFQKDDKVDYLELYSSKKQTALLEEINKKLNLSLNKTNNVDALDKIKENHARNKRINCNFRVHNVGQAQAVSLAVNGKPPFLYFDYGMPYSGNSYTKPPRVNMPTNPSTTIILSHLHKDHWFRITEDFNAFQCHWFIPDQPRSVKLNNIISGIIIHGGSVSIINSDIHFGRGSLTCGGVSKINPSRRAKHVHETGLSLRLEAQDTEGNELNILIAGDQRYDYIDASQLSNLDLLVASHHGGDYCWSAHGSVPKAKSLPSSTVIYSYGTKNTYNHPSNKNDYRNANWVKTYDTPDGDYAIIICL